MKTGFKNPIDKSPKPDFKPKDGKPETIWDYRHPHYDERSSCFVKAGSEYGVGYRNPVGTEKVSDKSAVPYGRIATMRIDESEY